MANDQGEAQETVEIIEDSASALAREEFEIPADLLDEPDPGAPAEGVETDPAQAEPPADPQARQPRDEKGKFLPKDQAPATEEGQPPEPLPAGQSEQPPAQAAQAGAEGEPPEEPELEFSFRADNQVFQIPGSKVTADGIFIPKEHQADFQRLLSFGKTYQGSYRQRLTAAERKVAETESRVQEDVERARALLSFWADMADREEKGELDEQGRTPLEAWLAEFRQNRVKLEAEAELAVARAYRDPSRRVPADIRVEGFDEEPAAEVSQEDLEQLSAELAPELGNRLQSMMRAENIRGLTGAEFTRIRDWMVDPKRIDQFYRRALQDIPAAEWGGPHDIKAGQIVAMDSEIRDAFKYQAQLVLDARKGAAELAKASAANAARGNGGNKVPPTTTVAGGGVPKGPKVPPQFKTKAEMEAWFNAEDPLT